MPRDSDGWCQLLSPTARVGTRYQFRINGELIVPDPASRFQPDDVGQPSEVIDTEAFAYQGEVFPLHDAPRGEPSADLPPEATIFFAQNHDQVGNRALGERLSRLVSPEKLKQALALVLLNPHIPMLFMGEEGSADTPFLFFADWSGEAAELTREGRRREFAQFQAFSTPEMRARIPDPCNEQTFLASKLAWEKLDSLPASLEFRALTAQLLKLRCPAR